MAKKKAKRNSQTIDHLPVAAGLAVVLYLLHFLPFLDPTARLWGLNHLLYLPAPYLIIYALLGLIATAVLFPKIHKPTQELFSNTADFLFESESVLRPLIISIIALIAFWFLRVPVSFLGDGYNVIPNIGNDIPVIVKWSETGAIKIVQAVARLLPYEGLQRGEYAYAIVSVISGATTIFIFNLLAGKLAKNTGGRLFIFCLLLFSGSTLLFFGYAENYPVIWPFIAAYLYFAVKYLHEGRGLIPATLCLIIAVTLHLQTVFFVISYPVLLFGRGRGARLYKRHKKTIWVAIALITVLGLMLFIRQFRESLLFRLHFMPLFEGRLKTPDYFLFSPHHLMDMLNLSLLLIPLWPALLVFNRRKLRRSGPDPIDGFLLLFSLGGLIFLCIIEPKLGLARDWDLFALAGLGPLLYLARKFADIKTATRLFPSFALLALAMTAPYLAVNLSHQPALAYFEYTLDLDLARSRPGRVFLRDHYYSIGDSTKADAIKSGIRSKFVEVRQVRRAQELSKKGQFEAAMALTDSIFGRDLYTVEAFNLRGLIFLRAGYFRDAIDDLEMSARMGRYDSRTMVNLANAYYQTGQDSMMIDCLRRGQKLNPDAIGVLQGLAMGFYSMKQYDSSLTYGEYLIEVDSTTPNGWLATGYTYYSLGEFAKAKKYLTRYMEIGPPGWDRQQTEKLLQDIAAREE